MDEIEAAGRLLLGVGVENPDIGVLQMGLRAAVIYVAALVVVRMAKKRFLGRATAFDVILGIMLGSIVSRAITGNAPMLPALAASAVLVLMHWLFSGVALRWHGFGHAIKGSPSLLVREGRVEEAAMRRAHMTEKDLREDLRSAGVSGLDEIAEARLERSGKLSVIKAKKGPKLVEVAVRDGVQTVRIELAG